SAFTPYSPTGLAGADTNWQTLMTDLMANMVGPGTATNQVSGQLSPAYLQELATISGPYGSAQQVAANQAGAYYGNMASQADQFHNIMTGQALTNYGNEAALTGAGNALWNTAQDPQNALRNRMQQQVTDASRASTSARGIGMSPEAAGIENQDVSRFLQDWQNQQLQRQALGLQGMTGAYKGAGEQGQAGGTNLSGAQAMSALAPQLLQQSASVPYQAQMAVPQNIMNASDKYIQSQQADQWGPLANLMSMFIPYMNYGAGAQANAFNAGQANLSNLTSLLGMFGGQGGGAGGSPFGTLSSLYSNPYGDAAGAFGGAAGAAGLYGAGADAGITGMTIADLAPLLAFA
ncbi:MAG: hypothetical protein ACYDAE_21615, partial [Steroidobacteraceae bacterium]